MDLIGWVLVGLLAAVAGELVLPGESRGGITATLLIGAAGVLLGRLIAGLLAGSGATGFDTLSILWATLGALAALAVYRLVTTGRRGG